VSSLRGRARSASTPSTPIGTAATRQTRSRRRLRVLEGSKLPYFLILPALFFELLIHIVPLLAGVGISFLKLTQFYIRNWTQAPGAGLKNYDLALRTVLDEDFALGEKMQRGFMSGLQAEVVYGRNEPALIHFHQRIRELLKERA
jgi:multiple sugar transport system permease protein